VAVCPLGHRHVNVPKNVPWRYTEEKMPITPEFVLSQDDEMCYVKIRVPYVRISDMEFIVDGT